jgi:hypothetical protein
MMGIREPRVCCRLLLHSSQEGKDDGTESVAAQIGSLDQCGL